MTVDENTISIWGNRPASQPSFHPLGNNGHVKAFSVYEDKLNVPKDNVPENGAFAGEKDDKPKGLTSRAPNQPHHSDEASYSAYSLKKDDLDHVSEKLALRKFTLISFLQNTTNRQVACGNKAQAPVSNLSEKDKGLLDSFLKKAEGRSIRVAMPVSEPKKNNSNAFLPKHSKPTPLGLNSQQNGSFPEFSFRNKLPYLDVHAEPFASDSSKKGPESTTRILKLTNIPALMSVTTIKNICDAS